MCGFKEKIIDFDLNKSGIYCIRNINNNKRYIGSTVKFKKRWISHICNLKNNKEEPNIYLQNSWNKHGREYFVFEIVECVENVNKVLREKEIYWINYFNSCNRDKGYNMSKDAGLNGNREYQLGRYTGEKATGSKLTFEIADKIRKDLLDIGFEVQDTKYGPVWRKR